MDGRRTALAAAQKETSAAYADAEKPLQALTDDIASLSGSAALAAEEQRHSNSRFFWIFCGLTGALMAAAGMLVGRTITRRWVA